jgi:hypothetical protein
VARRDREEADQHCVSEPRPNRKTTGARHRAEPLNSTRHEIRLQLFLLFFDDEPPFWNEEIKPMTSVLVTSSFKHGKRCRDYDHVGKPVPGRECDMGIEHNSNLD